MRAVVSVRVGDGVTASDLVFGIADLGAMNAASEVYIYRSHLGTTGSL